MTQIALLADIHGNLAALHSVLSELARRQVARIVVAGDLLTGGPQPQETLHALSAAGAELILGNNEGYVLSFFAPGSPPAWARARQWAVTRWACERLSQSDVNLLRQLPAQCVLAEAGCDPIRVVHGSPRGAAQMLFPIDNPEVWAMHRRAGQTPSAEPLRDALRELDESVLVCAHSHIAWAQRLGRHLVINPGSVGLPINGLAKAQFALLHWAGTRWDAEMLALPYDRGSTHETFARSGLLAEGGGLARALLLDIDGASNTSWFLVRHAYQLAEERGLKAGPCLPDALWDEAVASFPWPAAPPADP